MTHARTPAPDPPLMRVRVVVFRLQGRCRNSYSSDHAHVHLQPATSVPPSLSRPSQLPGRSKPSPVSPTTATHHYHILSPSCSLIRQSVRSPATTRCYHTCYHFSAIQGVVLVAAARADRGRRALSSMWTYHATLYAMEGASGCIRLSPIFHRDHGIPVVFMQLGRPRLRERTRHPRP